jgi:hypothetical protein
MDVDEPVYQNFPHLEINLTLDHQTIHWGVFRWAIVCGWTPLGCVCLLLHRLLVIIGVLSKILRVCNCFDIYWQDAWTLLVVSVGVVKLIHHLMELKNLLFVRLLLYLQNLVLNCLSWEILSKTLFDDLISKTLVDYVGVLRNLGLMLIDSNIIWVNLVILLDRGLIHLCRAQYWL